MSFLLVYKKRTIYLTDDTWVKQTNPSSLNERRDAGYKLEDNIYNDIVDYETDVVMLYHKKRCEDLLMSDEGVKQKEGLLTPYMDNNE